MKASKAQVEARVTELLRIRLDGAEWWDVCEYVRDKEQEEGSNWHLAEGAKPLSDSQLWRYLARVDNAIAESCRASRKKLLRRHQAQRRNLYAKAVSQGDIRTALQCARDEAELLGLYPSKGVKITGKGGTPIFPSFEAMVAALNQGERKEATNEADEQPRRHAGNTPPDAGVEALPG